MKKAQICFVLLLVTMFISLKPAGAVDGWSLIKDSNGIKLYERPVSGTELKEYMAVSAIDAGIEVIGEVLRDVPSYNKWLADCYGAEVEKQFSRNDMIIYMVLQPPVIDDRDLVLKDKAVYDYDNGKALVSFQATDEVKVPLQDGRIRVTVMTGFFDMEYLGRNRTKFSYRLKVDPAGDIAKKVAYSVMKTYPYDSIKGLKKMVTDKKYAALAKGTDEEKQIDSRAKNEGFTLNLIARRLAKFVKNSAALKNIISSDKNAIKAVMASGVSYEAVEKATRGYFAAYIEKTVSDRALAEKLAADKKFMNRIIDLVNSECGADNSCIENMIASYKK
ncbi:MAG TPA: hypothetical protein PK926_08230 [Spirochaetota bacterium]|nr:hypothetical protein [Spirochaetota bacterium]HPI88503.1 hypothetical protein [Spirochaetota bacterium]HPR47983.1 hypothetical protein [Spirochaetota bacterium]